MRCDVMDGVGWQGRQGLGCDGAEQHVVCCVLT